MRKTSMGRPRSQRGLIRKRIALGALAGALGLSGLVYTQSAVAGPLNIDAGFELFDGNLAPAAPINFDWNSFAPTVWTGTAPYRESEKTVNGWEFKGLEDEAAKTSDTGFAGGTKQDNDCASVIGSKAPNKDDLDRAYVTAKTLEGGDRDGHVILGLAWERIKQNSTSPSAHIGFEFNQGETACPAGSGDLVRRTVGDLLFVYDFEGGDVAPTISLRRWVDSGACEVGSNSPPCWGPSTDLTAAGDAFGAVNTGGSVSDAIGPGTPPATDQGTKEFGEAGIDLTDAEVFQPGECESFGTVYAVSRSSGSSATAQMKDLVGPGDFTLSNCGALIVEKVTVGGQGEFDFTSDIDGFETFTLDTTGEADNTDEITMTGVKEGTYNIAETVPEGWSLDSATCDNGDEPDAVEVTADETVTCTFTNSAQAKLTIEKVINDGSSTTFNFTSVALGNFSLTPTGTGAAGADSETFDNLDTDTTYDVAETVPDGWNLVSSTCDNGDDPSAIDLDPGDDVTCTFTNEIERGAIKITKTRKHAAAADPLNAPHAGVKFLITGPGLGAGVEVTTNAQGIACLAGLAYGDYTVTETVPSGYVADDAEQEVTVSAEATCESGDQADVSFHNTPLTNVTVSVDSQIDGGTSSTITCVDAADTELGTGSTGANGDGSVTVEDLEPTDLGQQDPPATLICTITVDP